MIFTFYASVAQIWCQLTADQTPVIQVPEEEKGIIEGKNILENTAKPSF